jgi:hypothetical protein
VGQEKMDQCFPSFFDDKKQSEFKGEVFPSSAKQKTAQKKF